MWKSLLELADQHSGAGQWVAGIIALIALSSAVWIGIVQNSINQKLANIESSAEVFGYLVFNASTPVRLRVTNVGKLQMYLTSYSINKITTLVPFALIPAGQQQNAWYDIRLPESPASVEFSLNLTDQLGKMWVSEIKVQNTEQGWEAYTYKIKRAKTSYPEPST